jgi:DNA-binding protein YbaB
MREETISSLQQRAGDLQRQMAEVREVYRQIRAVTGTARTRDGMVRVEVGSQGELRDIHFDPRTFEGTRPQALAHTIMQLVAEATAEATGRTRELTAGALPEELAARVRGGEEDLMSLFPDAPSIRDDLR